MYIPTWILIGLVVAFFVYSSKQQKGGNSGILGINSNKKEDFAYKLTVSLEPNWYQIIKRLYKPDSDNEWEKLEKKLEKIKKDPDVDLVGRRYLFTEFYDSRSGMTSRFQRTFYPNGKQVLACVEEFGDGGYLYEALRDEVWNKIMNEKKRDKGEEEQQNLAIQIGENYIRKNIFDKYVGGMKYDFDFEDKDYVFHFPLHDIFNFLFALGQRFYDTEDRTIVKWPDKIEQQFKKLNIKYETYFDFEPKLFDIEEHDSEFYQKMGKPKVSLYSDSQFQKGYLSSDEAYFSVSLKLYRPDSFENNRITENYSCA